MKNHCFSLEVLNQLSSFLYISAASLFRLQTKHLLYFNVYPLGEEGEEEEEGEKGVRERQQQKQ